MKLSFLFMLILYSGFVECQSKNNPKAEKIDLAAVILMARNYDNVDSLNLALNYLDSSIALDSSYYSSFRNRAQIECILGKYNESIKDMDYVLKLKPDFLEIKGAKGFTLEKMGRKNEANQTYKETIKDYDKKIKTYPDSVNNYLNRTFLVFILEGKDSGNASYLKIKQKFPENQTVEMFEQVFAKFNHDEFIHSFCGTVNR